MGSDALNASLGHKSATPGLESGAAPNSKSIGGASDQLNKLPKITVAALEAWMKKRVLSFPPGQQYPGFEDDWDAARAAFPEYRIPRQSMRNVLASGFVPTPWTNRGTKRVKK